MKTKKPANDTSPRRAFRAELEAVRAQAVADVAAALLPICSLVARDPSMHDSDAREKRIAGYAQAIDVALSALTSLLPGLESGSLPPDGWRAFKVAEAALRWVRDVTMYPEPKGDFEQADLADIRERLRRAHHIACDSALTKNEAQVQALNDLNHMCAAPELCWMREHVPLEFGRFAVIWMCRWTGPTSKDFHYDSEQPPDELCLLAARAAAAWNKNGGRPSKWALANDLLTALGNGSTPVALKQAWKNRNRRKYPAPKLRVVRDPAAVWREALNRVDSESRLACSAPSATVNHHGERKALARNGRRKSPD